MTVTLDKVPRQTYDLMIAKFHFYLISLSGNVTTFSLTEDEKGDECWIEFTLVDRYDIARLEIVNR